MQFQLSTLFLLIFMAAASLALTGSFGVFVAAIVLFAALLLNRITSLENAIAFSIFFVFFGMLCPALLPAFSSAREAARRAQCLDHLRQIGLALHDYNDANKHFPSLNTSDKHGEPFYSWRTEILPMMEYGYVYNLLKKDEPWNSQYNTKVLSRFPPRQYPCPSASHDEKPVTNYLAIIGPGTAWREDGPVRLSDLPDRGSHTVMLVEMANSDVHWAEPRDLTVDEALEGLKTGKGLRISTAHPSVINVLLADGSVRSLPAKMPLSVWEKLLAGEIKDVDTIEKYIDASAPDMVDISITPPATEKWRIILSAIVWLLSVALLFRRAVKSRRKLVIAEADSAGVEQ
jgi:hypothetical protein